MYKTMKQFINNLSIRNKIFISYVIVLCITFIFLLQSNSFMITKETREEVAYSAKKSLNQTKSFLDFKAASSKEIVNVLASNSMLQTVLKIDPSIYKDDIGLWSIDRDKLQQVLYSSQTNPDIKDIKLYMEKGPASIFETSRFLYMGTNRSTALFQNYNYFTPLIQWYKGEEFEDTTSPDYIIVLKNILNESNLKENIGIIRVDFEAAIFSDVLNQTDITESAIAMLINPGYLLCTSDLSNKIVDPTLLDQVQKYVKNLDISEYPYWNTEILIDDQKMLLGVEQIELTDWQLILIIPEKDILESVSHIRVQFFSLFLLILPLSLIMTYIITFSFTKRLSRLASEMHNLDNSTFYKDITPSSKDEIGILTQNFNYMLIKISMLLDEKFELGQAAKNSELMALQAQINPHFLYNTLDQIYWIGIRHNVPDISNLVIELSKFYKLSLNKGKSIVSLENEIELINAYINIQNFRFDNVITLEVSISNDYLQTKLPKITLQPIVENGILHGICEKEAPGTIRISARSENDVLYISIVDDGQGMDEETLASLLTEQTQPTNVSHGYGLSNINNRLKLTFGPEFGLTIMSKLNVGTEVILKLPLDISTEDKF